MSSDVAIKVENLSKCYHIYDKPRDRLMQMLPFGRKQYFREFWALKDVSFDIRRGETIGIIGRNGSGKSTLLQMICGTLNPSGGTVQTNGRIAALLELGAGFNPEFTGRENVYLNSTVLGLSQHEIENCFDDIASFADIGNFIDQPIKLYSSGMMVRLAFAVAIHVKPDILIVDEALSVGDAYFQAKCANRVRKIIDDGATLLFVSHDTASVKSLCNRAVLLEKGYNKFVGDVNTAVEQYYSALVASQNENVASKKVISDKIVAAPSDNTKFLAMANYQRIQNGVAELINVVILDENGIPTESVIFGQLVTLRQMLRVNSPVTTLGFAYHIRDKNGLDIIYSDSGIEGEQYIQSADSGGLYTIDWTFKVHLREGSYVISSMVSHPIDLRIGNVEVVDFIPISVQFSVSKGSGLPIYAAAYWENHLRIEQIEYAKQ